MMLPAGVSERYDLFPSTEHMPGDIWLNLPTGGLVRGATACGIVISPACDLANCKAETITFLPVISVKEYLGSGCMVLELRSALNELLSRLKAPSVNADPQRTNLPSAAEIEAANEVVSFMAGKPSSQEQSKIVQRCLDGLSLLSAMRGGHLDSGQRLKLVRSLLGEKKLDETTRRLVTNQVLSTHYLPPDGSSSGESLFPAPSVALLRYPLSAPTSIFE